MSEWRVFSKGKLKPNCKNILPTYKIIFSRTTQPILAKLGTKFSEAKFVYHKGQDDKYIMNFSWLLLGFFLNLSASIMIVLFNKEQRHCAAEL